MYLSAQTCALPIFDIWNDIEKVVGPRSVAVAATMQRKFSSEWAEWLEENQNQGGGQYIEPPDVSTSEPEPPSEISEIFKGWRTFLK